MPDFTLEPSDIEPERPERRRRGRLVSTGLHPHADLPTSRRKDRAPVYVPCEACGAQVVTGATASGRRLALDPHVTTYTILWHHEAAPVLQESRAYPVHHCGAPGATPEDAA